MCKEINKYIDSQEPCIKAQYNVLKDRGYLGLIKEQISLEERIEDLKGMARLINRQEDMEREVSLGM